MTDVEFYSGLNYDFYIHEQDKKLNGLTPYGFTDNHRPLNV